MRLSGTANTADKEKIQNVALPVVLAVPLTLSKPHTDNKISSELLQHLTTGAIFQFTAIL